VREIRASVTRRGRETIPAVVRRHLGVGSPDKVMFVLDENGVVTLRSFESAVLKLTGTLRPLRGETAVDFEAEIADAIDEEMERQVETLRRQ
jgi:bifunctional DNA-binding transcriptional regulator/antitoxin component of YhaV-PrlF toxin-antitoxin module